jgi:Ca-activated chloride channel homolog
VALRIAAHVTWQSPWWLLSLLAVPLVAAAMLAQPRRRSRLAAEYADPGLVDTRPARRGRVMRVAAAVAALGCLASCAIALARPSITDQTNERRGTVMLALDISRSMQKTDIAPTRLQAALDAATRFVDSAPDDVEIGLVSFADTAQVVVSPTKDRGVLTTALRTRFTDVREGTAIGDAIATSLGALQTAGALTPTPATAAESPGRILLLTDGAQSAGTVLPAAGADRAATARAPVYTILLGNDPGRLGQATPAETLASIATRTGGVYAKTTTNDDLARVFADIGRIVAPVPRLRELTYIPAAIALGLLVLSGGLMLASGAARSRGGMKRPHASALS